MIVKTSAGEVDLSKAVFISNISELMSGQYHYKILLDLETTTYEVVVRGDSSLVNERDSVISTWKRS